MTRLARVVVLGYPHHITQRGNRRQPTFFEPSDYKLYLTILKKQCAKFDVDVWAYCLMPNHIHLVVVPSTKVRLRKAIGESHRRYTRAINKRMGNGDTLTMCPKRVDNSHLKMHGDLLSRVTVCVAKMRLSLPLTLSVGRVRSLWFC